MTTPLHSKRALCAVCQRPQSACICQWITPVRPATEVLVLQHPLEVKQAKGSARLLHLSLPDSRMVTGEVFEPAELQALLTQPWHSGAGKRTSAQPVLLYPHTPLDSATALAEPVPLPPAAAQRTTPVRLVVLDGTWRKSRKMLHCNPLLQALPRLSLTDVPPSGYRIRKAHRADQLSTLEAVCAALVQLGEDPQQMQRLEVAFSGFVDQQWGYRPSSDPDQ